MHILAIANIKWGKVSVHGIELDPNDTNYYSGNGDTTVLLNGNHVERILFSCDSLGTEYIYPGVDKKLYSKTLGMYLEGTYQDGEYVVTLPLGLNVSKMAKDVIYWPYKPDGTSLVYCTSAPVSLTDAIERGQRLGKFEDELRVLIGSSRAVDYLDMIEEVLSLAPASYRDGLYPLHDALKWALAERKGKL